MTSGSVLSALFAQFPVLKDIPDQERGWIEAHLQHAVLPAGQTVFSEGDACTNFILVLRGSVQIRKTSETGREIVLYRVEAGQTCVLTTACLLGRLPYGAEGLTETETEALVLPRGDFDALMAKSPAFRQFVFAAYADRVSGLMMLIEEVAFGRIDLRLAQCLLARRDADNVVHGTHYDLAVELGTAREVVSRQLKEFEKRGLVDPARGRIILSDPDGLAALKDA
ncbi:MAG: Crp/Fnr family transcriptional regulator [Rhodospirillaceae bacterium]